MADHHSSRVNVSYASESLTRALDILNEFSDRTVQDLSMADKIAYAQAQASVGMAYATLAVATRQDQADESAEPHEAFDFDH